MGPMGPMGSMGPHSSYGPMGPIGLWGPWAGKLVSAGKPTSACNPVSTLSQRQVLPHAVTKTFLDGITLLSQEDRPLSE